MVQFTVSTSIAADRSAVWNVLADYGNISAWNSGIDASRLVTEAGTGVGAVRTCDLSNGMAVRERIIDWRDDDSYQLVFDEMPAPVKDATVRFRLDGDAPTQVSVDYSYKGKGIGVLAAPLMKPMFKKAMQGLLSDLKAHCEATEG